MITLNSYTSSPDSRVTSHATSAATLSAASADERESDISISTLHSDTTSTVSILANQLSGAATRAEARTEQGSTELLAPITGEQYFANKARHDAEVPTTNNSEHLARARQATAYINGADSNPFKGLARDQLSLIARDDGGPFTINERRAAWQALQSTVPPAVNDAKPAPGSGREMMILRLFGGREPPVATPPASAYNLTQNRNEFLNLDDRALIADMYAYAQAEGADLRHVDLLVMSFSTYRYYSDGTELGGGNTGYDGDGYRVTFDFIPQDVATAARILNGSAITSTRLDRGFLQYILNPDHGAFSNIGGIPFLERMVNRFSSEGADQPPLGSEFATLKEFKREDHIVRTVHKDIRLPPHNPITSVVDGVWTLTEFGKAQGYTMDPTNGRLSKSITPPDDQAQQPLAEEPPTRTIIESLADTPNPPATRWIWPGHLFKMLKNFKP